MTNMTVWQRRDVLREDLIFRNPTDTTFRVHYPLVHISVTVDWSPGLRFPVITLKDWLDEDACVEMSVLKRHGGLLREMSVQLLLDRLVGVGV